MGLCSSEPPKGDAEEQGRNKKLNRMLERDHEKAEEIHKLLLLGAGESGKSTLFKQMMAIYGDGFSEAFREGYKGSIFATVIDSMRDLVFHSEKFYDKDKDKKYKIDAKNKKFVKTVTECKANLIDATVGEAIHELWNDPAIRETWEWRHLMQIPDTADHFFVQALILGKEGYIPSEDDVLRARVRTSGVVENTFTIQDNQFAMYDVGGQRSERKKWVHQFEDVSCVLFVVSISAYNQVLFEDGITNRMVEALHLFDEICNSEWFQRSSMVLFLNKSDLFVEKIKKFPITDCPALKDFEGDLQDFEQTAKFIEEEFLLLNKSALKTVFPHVTCATDRHNVAVVFNSVKDTVLKQSLEQAGLVVT
mmetsp:Transcript_2806/g.6530  ORF Transcript_2806/g.6530 Transcript_2806/m.6530 type:complete len:364 (-) Transcript_2806:191-1282(-)|eukprot:CAMPEP_0114526318 /NCGR_PEP_ID=MMETSP0109-20121206/22949_1 /TAXON_ID=29199 /ORGANISM="Chlorarachnion reptans, Strain CCCM449" /LENGTH=363 /DNA_ID=CAMNT_0001708069 /DNA_START=86 /DNA_END=1177 /DNA_ORIENTATION=+